MTIGSAIRSNNIIFPSFTTNLKTLGVKIKVILGRPNVHFDFPTNHLEKLIFVFSFIKWIASLNFIVACF